MLKNLVGQIKNEKMTILDSWLAGQQDRNLDSKIESKGKFNTIKYINWIIEEQRRKCLVDFFILCGFRKKMFYDFKHPSNLTILK